MPANSAFAQVDCTLSFDNAGQIDLGSLARTLSNCPDTDAPAVWSELIDRGTYGLLYSGLEDSDERRITGIAHSDWAQDIPLEIGALFGFRAAIFADGDLRDQTIQIVTHFPDGPDGPRPPDVTDKPLTPGATEAALFLIGSGAFAIPGLWRIELRYDGQILAAQQFNLIAP